MCPHPLDQHDAIAQRFCTATSAGALSRGCICLRSWSLRQLGARVRCDLWCSHR